MLHFGRESAQVLRINDYGRSATVIVSFSALVYALPDVGLCDAGAERAVIQIEWGSSGP